MFAEAYLQCAQEILQQYSLQQPLHLYLKAYFKQHRQFGSRDRRYISELVYAFYRLGPQESHRNLRDQLITAAWIKSELPPRFFERTSPELAARTESTAKEKYDWAVQHQGVQPILPYTMSGDSPPEFLHEVLFGNPRVFIRIRKNKTALLKSLQQAAIPFREEQADCLSFEPNVKLDEILSPADFVVQDMASQAVGQTFEPAKQQVWWDCCAASGGKSILLLDKEPVVRLTVSDLRPSILHNLKLRLHRYHPKQIYRSLCLDLTKEIKELREEEFDAIICDAPCSGSGTWARTPEQYYFFTTEKLEAFQQRQKEIVTQILPKLKSGGTLYYITCSVFRKENEELSEYLQALGCILQKQQLIDFHDRGGDCLFVVEFRKTNGAS